MGHQALARSWRRMAAGPFCRSAALAMCMYRIYELSRSNATLGSEVEVTKVSDGFEKFVSDWIIPQPLLSELVNERGGRASFGDIVKTWNSLAADYGTHRKDVILERAKLGVVWHGYEPNTAAPGDLVEASLRYISGDANPTHVPSILQRVAIAERDAILAENFRTQLLHKVDDCSNLSDSVAVAVVGRAHLSGIRTLWNAGVMADDFVRLTAGEQVEEIIP